MGYQYRALSNGTLSNPYRFVLKGEKVTLEEPLKASWLVLETEYVEKKPLPITPYLGRDGRKTAPLVAQASPTQLPAIKDANYDAQLKDIKKFERQMDGLPPLPEKTGEVGTGNKEVI